jgi:predicted O-linked N-acetylglucosamine transferase (SPINDLY family)
MGCPLVTYTGRSFGARMAGALLTAAGLPELITYNLADYEALALALANDPARCAALRATLGTVRESGVLFDTPRFVRDLEERFQDLVAGLAPAPAVGA